MASVYEWWYPFMIPRQFRCRNHGTADAADHALAGSRIASAHTRESTRVIALGSE